MQIWLYQAFFVVLQMISTHQAMRRHLLFLAVLLGLLTTVRAQDDTNVTNALEGRLIDPVPEYVKPVSHLDFSLTTGSTGLGFDVSMPINDVFSLRAGYAFMPHVKHMMHFGVDVGDDPAESQSKFGTAHLLELEAVGRRKALQEQELASDGGYLPRQS